MARDKQSRRNAFKSSPSFPQVDLAPASNRPTFNRSVWLWGAAFLGVLVLAVLVYEPALAGPFVFDDFGLPFRHPNFRGESILDWMASVRPLLMLSYWFNYQVSGRESTASYHLLNVVIHCVNTLLVGAIFWRLLQWTKATDHKQRAILAVLGAGVFLLHPLQSESVAYIAGRSESLSALWCLAALAISVYRPFPAISGRRALAILALFGAAIATKEHAVALAGVLLLADVIFPGTSLFTAIDRDWKLYFPLTAGTVIGIRAASKVLASSTSAGFAMQGMHWQEYALTQGRVVLAYLKLVVLPVGLTVDHDFALSRSLLDGGAGLAILFWVGAAITAIVFRHKYPVACFGVLIFLVLLAPTSSIVPIKDVMVERRMYLPFVGLLLVALDGLSRIKLTDGTMAALSACTLIVLAFCTYDRSKAWGDSKDLWESAIAATPAKARPYGNLASVYLVQRKCVPALNVFERASAAGVQIKDGTALATWALALECSGSLNAGIAKMQEAVKVEPSAQAYASLGRMYVRASYLPDAERALAEAERLNPAWETTYVYRAMLESMRHDEQKAVAELKKALTWNPGNLQARQMLEETAARSRYMP